MKIRFLVLMALVLLAFIARVLPEPRTVDDAFITFRYSRNIVEGNGFVYNTGVRILGTTTPLYTLLMAGFGAFPGGVDAYPWYALFVNAIAGAVCVALMFYITLHLTTRLEFAAWAGAAWALAPFSVTFAIGGMETSVHNAFMLGAWFAYLKDKPRWLGAACALGVLTRPDALIWAAPLLLHQLWTYFRAHSDTPLLQRIPLQTWGVGLLIISPWLIFAAWYFGSPIPHTISTKANVYTIESMQALVRLLQHYAIPFQDQFTLSRYGVMLGIVLYPALALIGLRWAMVREKRSLPMLAYPWLYFAIFAILNPLIFRWYLTPPMPAYFVSILCGVAALMELLRASRPMAARNLTAALAAITILFTLNSWTLNPDHGPNRPAPQMAFHELELNYAKMAGMLREEYGVNEDTILAAGDIGALGFYSRAHIFDTIGLVTEGTVDYYTPELMQQILVDDANYAIPPDLILDAQPEYVVLMESFVRKGLALDERFTQQYEQIYFIPTDYYGTGMLAYRRLYLDN